MKVCCGCQTNTCDTYYPTSCKCIIKEKKDIESSKEAAAYFCKLSGNPSNQWYFDGLCLGCWNKMFEPTYDLVVKTLYYKNVRGIVNQYRKKVYTKRIACPRCKWCNKKYNVDKCNEMDSFPYKKDII